MSDMRPWLEAGAESEIAELLRAGRPAEPLGDAARERSRRRLQTLEQPRRRAIRLEALPAAATVLLWVQHAALGAGLGVVVAVTAAAPRLIRRFSEPSAPANSVRAPQKAPGLAPPRNRESPPRARASEGSVSSAPLPSASVAAFPDPSTESDDFALEFRLLERAKSQLERDPEGALRTLRSHRADFANGKLALEREFLTVATLVRLERLVEARAYANSLRARAPGNLYDARLRKLLGDPTDVP